MKEEGRLFFPDLDAAIKPAIHTSPSPNFSVMLFKCLFVQWLAVPEEYRAIQIQHNDHLATFRLELVRTA
jgi:hypothetical protein